MRKSWEMEKEGRSGMRLTLIDSSMYSFCGISVYSSVGGSLASESEEKERERSSHS